MGMNFEQAQGHASFKEHEMRPGVHGRLVTELWRQWFCGEPCDYAKALRAAVHPVPPQLVYHTAPAALRERIAAEGLRPCAADASPHWRPEQNCGQPAGVYVGAQPDTSGVWAHWPSWDVWEVRLDGLKWEHDEMNEACYVITHEVAPERLRLVSSHSW